MPAENEDCRAGAESEGRLASGQTSGDVLRVTSGLGLKKDGKQNMLDSV